MLVLGPTVAGSWYPRDRNALERMVDDLLEPVGRPEEDPDSVLALVEPHAGFVYSGRVAGAGFARVRGGRPHRVVLLGPSHHAGFAGGAVPEAEAYRTPLGDVPLDLEAARQLSRTPRFRMDDSLFLREHSLEAEIPFLQRVLAPGFELVPVLVGGGTDSATAWQIAESLRPLLGAGTLVVASSDFTHYGPRFDYVPFDEGVPERIRALDYGAIDRILHLDVTGFDDYLARTGATVCGRHALDVLLRLLPARAPVEVAAYDTSGRITGDWENSVSYASLVVRRTEAIDPVSRALLLRLARAAVLDSVERGGTLERLRASFPVPEALQGRRASFVTLRRSEPLGGPKGGSTAPGELRGCIGSTEADEPLYLNVIRNAGAAALEDPRFSPLTASELDAITIEISVLTPLRAIAHPAAIVLGRHGVALEARGGRALFLPQVAVQQRWDLTRLLQNLARKAGLPRDAWRSARLAVFETESFGERPSGPDRLDPRIDGPLDRGGDPRIDQVRGPGGGTPGQDANE